MRWLLPSRRVRHWIRLSAWRAFPLFLGVLMSLVIASSALAATYNIKITAPAAGATLPVGSDVTITVDTGGITLVPAPQATSPNDLHLHYLLDVDPSDLATYLSGSVAVPLGNPNIVHTTKTSVTFSNVSAGKHTVTVFLADPTHHVVQPPVHPSVTFTVGDSSTASGSGGGGDATTSLPKSGGTPIEVLYAFAAVGFVLVVLGLGARRVALRAIEQPAEAEGRPEGAEGSDLHY